MTLFRFYLAILIFSSQLALAGILATVEWSFEPSEGIQQLAPYPDSEHAEGVLLTGNSGQIQLVAPGGRVISSMRLDLPASTNAVPVRFRRGEEARIVAADNEGSIYCFRGDGVRLWKYLRRRKASDFRVLTVADVEGNGTNEILMSDYRGNVYTVDSTGHLRFEVTATNFRVSPSAAKIINDDDRATIVFGTDDKDLYAVRSNGELVWHAYAENPVGRALPIIATLESKPIALVSTPFVGQFQGLEAVDARTGNALWKAPSLLQSYQSIVVADIDGDGAPEVLFGDKSNRVYCLDAHGKQRWAVHLDGRGIYPAAAIADLEGKGQAVVFQATRAESVNGNNLYAIDHNGAVIESWALPGGGGGSPILCRWQSDNALHLLVAGNSGNLLSFRLTQSPGARILWTGLQGSFASAPDSPAHVRANAPEPSAASKIVSISFGTTAIYETSNGAHLVSLRVTDPDGTVHLTLLKSYSGEPVSGELLAASPGDYDVTAIWYGADSHPVQTEHSVYRASARLNLSVPRGSGDLAAYVNARLSSMRQVALASGKVDDYDAAHAEAAYDTALMATVARLHAQGRIMIQSVHNPWVQLTSRSMLAEDALPQAGIQVQMLGNEYASAAVSLTNITTHPLTLALRATVPNAIQFRDMPIVVPDTTGKPQQDPLPLFDRSQTVRLAPAETREIWLTLHSSSLDAGRHAANVQISELEQVAPPIQIPVELTVSRVRLPEHFSYKHCNWLYLSSIKDEHLLDATITDAVEHRTNVFNVSAATVSVNCNGEVESGDTGATDRLIPRLPGAFYLVDGSVTLQWPAGCSPDQRTQDVAYSEALHWYGNHMRQMGLTNADYALYLQDEPGLNGGDARVDLYVQAVKRVKAADPGMQVYTNPAGGAWPSVVKPLSGVTDIWCPDLHLFRLYPADLTAGFSKARQFWHYEAPGDQRGLDPLGFYRMKPWIAFQLGMNGGGYWVYSSKDYWIPSHDSEYGVVYPGPQGPVTTKRWEASREGSQDYELLMMLRNAAHASSSENAKSALALIDEAVAFVTRDQEQATDISRHFHAYAPDFDTWMNYRAKLMTAAEELIH